jgi:hypothetical protein
MISSRVRYVFGKRCASDWQAIGNPSASDAQAIGKRSACLRRPCSQDFTTISAPATLHQSAQVQADQRIAMRQGSEQGLDGTAVFAGAEILWSGVSGRASRHSGLTPQARRTRLHLPQVHTMPLPR